MARPSLTFVGLHTSPVRSPLDLDVEKPEGRFEGSKPARGFYTMTPDGLRRAGAPFDLRRFSNAVVVHPH